MKEGKVFKRILAVALVVVMTITMVPFGVFAEGEGAVEVVCTHTDATKIKPVTKVNATCTEAGKKAHYICEACNEVVMPEGEGYKTYTFDLTIPALGHDLVEVAAKDATCTEDGHTAYKDCSRCDYKEGYVVVDAGHTIVNHTAQAATCTAAGWAAYDTCSKCDYTTKVEIPATGHSYGTDGKCENCTAVCPHTETYIVNGREPTCTEPGVSEGKRCKACNKLVEGYGNIDALNHPAENVKNVEATAATCENDGYTAGKLCELCNTYIEGHVKINALGHTWSTGLVVKDDKQHGKQCATCKEFKELANHAYETLVEKASASCSKTGKEVYKCACGDTKETILPIDENAHKWSAFTVIENATCLEKGSKKRVCELNESHTETVEIPVEAHNGVATAAKAATCVEDGNTAYWTCTKCNKIFSDAECKIETKLADTVIAKGEHVYTKYELSADATCTAHAKETAKCDICKEATHTRDIPATMVAHTFKNYVSDNNATCIKDGTMSATCEMCKIEKDTKDEVGSKERAEHTPDKDGVRCTLCGKELVCVHTYSTEKLITKVAKCDEDGQKAIVCSKCQAHKPGSEEVIPALGHKWDEGTVTTAPTCKEKGAKLHKCENAGCDETKVEEMAIVDHDYQPVVTQPTCTEDGYTTYTCSMCKSHYVDDQVDAFGHMFDTYYYDEGSATCYQDGTKTATCSNGCGAKNTVADPGSKTDHEVTDFTVIKEATCLEEGEQEAKCFYHDKCGYSEIVPIDALGHDIPADFVTDKEPTCTEKGSKSKKCTRCSETVATEEIPALGHAVNADYTVDVAATCLEAGKQSKHCARCDYKEGETTIPALGHDYQPAAGTEATCLEGGYAKFTCTRCADTYEEANSPALGHNFVYISDNNATCKEDGTESGKCSRCDATDTRTQVGSKLSHVLGEPVVTPATTKADGVITKTCTLCNDYNETEEIAKIAGMKLRYTVVAYDGKYKRPGLTITDANGTKLVKGEDYTLVLPTKEECSEIGTFTYTINFMGNYEGEDTISYKVVPGKAAKLVAKTTRQSYITLKWSAVKGADGYRVYVKNSKGNWKTLATVKGKNYYKVEDLKAGTEYEFAVKAYAKTDDGTVWATEYIEGAFKTLPGKTSKITYKSNKSAVKLTWKEVKGADGYRVYVYNTKTKKYTTVATVKGKTSYTVKELKAGTTYKFAVKAYYKYDGATVWSNQYTTINTKTAK